MNQHDPTDAAANRLTLLADAVKLVSLLETTAHEASAAQMIGARARRRAVASIYRGRKSAGGKEARYGAQ